MSTALFELTNDQARTQRSILDGRLEEAKGTMSTATSQFVLNANFRNGRQATASEGAWRHLSKSDK